MNWKMSKEEIELVMGIVDRLIAKHPDVDRLSLCMDITAVHLNGCPLQLEELLGCSDRAFYHDVGGIIENVNRQTGKLENCFLPIYADSSGETN